MMKQILMVATVFAAAATSTFAQEGQGAVYMRTKESAVVRNFPDQNGAALATIAPGTVVRAFRSSSGTPVFREVEVAGGFPVWVYGAYLQQTGAEDVLLVTGSRVNMRPLPELTPAAMALRSKLDGGERVLMLARANKAAKFSEDWIRIQAPIDAKAWIADGSLEPVDAKSAQTAWAKASVALPVAPKLRPGANVRAASSKTGKASVSPLVSPVKREVLQSLSEADKAFEAAAALKSPTAEAWRDVTDAYAAVLAAAPAESITYTNAEARAEEARLRMEVAALREDLNADRQRKDEEIRQIDEFLDHRKRQRTAHWDRFEERGWLESRNVGGAKRWYLVFGGETVAEVKCMNQRYEMDVFEGFEIGVIGHEVAPVVRATQNSLAEARIVDIQRIEVISGSKARR